MIVRILIWSGVDSQTTIEELRDAIPELEPPSQWIWNEASERFGVVASARSCPRRSAGRRT